MKCVSPNRSLGMVLAWASATIRFRGCSRSVHYKRESKIQAVCQVHECGDYHMLGWLLFWRDRATFPDPTVRVEMLPPG
ncbi:hypothetical protein ACQ4M4_23460 [Leptolyngbya sp. AN02str]|uniref:hypothetical protein n=1 Tax=Leptolyngbya sp. AN02str TaxID=3423363 RepID=UPI003D31152C